MNIVKPKLSVDEQIEHLKSKGVLFNIMDEEKAKDYLKRHNNYFKLTAYRKNYPNAVKNRWELNWYLEVL